MVSRASNRSKSRTEVNVHIVDPQKLTLARAAAFVAETTGVKPHINTMTRWVLHGVRGHRLRAMRVGRAWVTTKSDVLELLAQLNDVGTQDSMPAAESVLAQQRAELARQRHATLAHELGVDS
jgi:hypothetical protein